MHSKVPSICKGNILILLEVVQPQMNALFVTLLNTYFSFMGTHNITVGCLES